MDVLSFATAGAGGCLPRELAPGQQCSSHGPARAGAEDLARALSKD